MLISLAAYSIVEPLEFHFVTVMNGLHMIVILSLLNEPFYRSPQVLVKR